MLNIRKWLNHAAQLLPYDNAYQEAVYLAKEVLGQEVINMEWELNDIARVCLDLALEKRSKQMPLAKITQKKHFYSHCFRTTLDTLDPRCVTEELIEKINVNIKINKILELGVGTGCVIISILKKFNKAKGIGVDISASALKIAQENANVLKVSNRIQLMQRDWANGLTGHFDLIISNPPYVASDALLEKEAQHDPALALFGSAQTYKDVFKSIKVTFHQILLEVPQNLLGDVIKLAQRYFKSSTVSSSQIYNSDIFIVCIEEGI